jgi:hypothetical protein
VGLCLGVLVMESIWFMFQWSFWMRSMR